MSGVLVRHVQNAADYRDGQRIDRHCCIRGWEQRLSCLGDERRWLCRPIDRALGVRWVPVSA
jgi:hypothetical protein